MERYMDCARPTYASPSSIRGTVDPEYDVVIPCRRDGYQRINSLPARPTHEPTTFTFKPTTSAPTMDPLCCRETKYFEYDWQYCANPADPANKNVADCTTCLVYSCVDWLAGSAGMQQREASYLDRTGDSVYFGVGSYGSDTTKAGLCYRVTAATIDRDLIVQVVTQGGDVADGNFNLYIADGGLGYQSACTYESSL